MDQYTQEVSERLRDLEPTPSHFLDTMPYEAAAGEPPRGPLTVCYAHTDFEDTKKEWEIVVRAFRLAATTVYPDCSLATIGFSCEKDGVMPVRSQIYAKMRRSIRGNHVFIDTDVMCNRRVDHVFDEDFDVGLTDSPLKLPLMPFNDGVIFAKDTPGAQLYFDMVMEMSNRIPRMDGGYLHQIAMCAAYHVLKDRVKFKILPHAEYNFSPGNTEPTEAYFIHLKGKRKALLKETMTNVMARYGKAQETALPGAMLTMNDPYPDPQGLRDIQPNIVANTARGLKLLYKEEEMRRRAEVHGGTEKVAIVGYGPSLRDTWEALKNWDGVIWTVSKAHDFLLERGVTPHYHMDLDYREHKAYFNKIKSGNTVYVLGTQVHPKYLDMLPDACVRLFHSDIPTGHQSGPGYWKIAAQFDVGLQAAFTAYLLGYKDQHWFGLDASLKDGETHAGSHEGVKSELVPVWVDGRAYMSSALLVRQALFCERMICRYPLISPTIYGNGMLRPFLQERGRCRVKTA